MKYIILLSLHFIAYFCISSNIFASEFHINNNSELCNDNDIGNITTPWCTIGKANIQLQPGDTVYIHTGVYDEVIAPKQSGLPENPIVYKSNPGDKVIVRGTPGAYQVVSIGFFQNDWNPKSHIIIDGFYIERGYPYQIDNTRHFLISIVGPESTHNVIRNCAIKGTDKPLLEAWNSANGLRVGGISISKSSNNLIENNTISNMTYVGILVGGVPRSLFNVIRGNRIGNIIQDGIHTGTEIADSTLLGLLIEDNEIYGSVISDGIQADGCNAVADTTCTGVSGVIVRKNRIYNNAENNIDLKGTSHWLIENNILFGASGNNDGGTKAMPDYGCATPPCNNTQGGVSIGKGGNRYSHDIIIRNNVIYDGNGGSYVGDGYIIYNNTILNNRRTYAGSNQDSCSTDGCSRHPPFPGLYGPGEDAVIVNNIVGDNGFAIYSSSNPKWLIDRNGYYWPHEKQFRGLAQEPEKYMWKMYTLEEWQHYLKGNSQSSGQDIHSFLITNPENFFKRVPRNPTGDSQQFDFNVAGSIELCGAENSLTETVGDGHGVHIPVKDSRYFSDGYGLIAGDLVIVGTNPAVRIVKNDTGAKSIQIGQQISWKDKDPVRLARLSSTSCVGATLPVNEPTSPSLIIIKNN